MASVQTLMGSGLPAATAIAVNAGTAAVGLTAAGTTDADALQLVADCNVITTAASSAVGVKLPNAEVGSSILILNGVTGNSFKVYASAGSQINNLTVTTGNTVLGASKGAIATRVTAAHWIFIGDAA